MDNQKIKIALLYICKYVGLFKFSKYLTRKKFRILCYHGFSFSDEYLFRPKLFIRPETLAKRLQYVAKAGFKVYPLTFLLNNQQHNQIPEHSLAITVDDGWKGLYELAQPIFRDFQFPWTLYLTTYYMEKGTQVADVAIQYVLWKTTCKKINLQELITGNKKILDLSDDDLKNEAFEYLYEHCLTLDASQKRQDFINRLAKQLKVNWQEVLESEKFFISSADEINQLTLENVDVQLHTHRHFLPETSKVAMLQEIEDNREVIKRICGVEANHLCYPSGYFTEQQTKWLEAYGIGSGVTCHPGLNGSDTNILKLKRFLDGEDIHPIEFEAELSGFKHLVSRFYMVKHPEA